MILGIGYFFFFVRNLVCYTAVFSVVTQSSLWGGALRDDTKNGCVADYTKSCAFFFSSAKTAQLPSLLLSLFLSISVQLPSIVSVNIFQILSTLAAYEELPGGFKPTKSAEIFWTNIFLFLLIHLNMVPRPSFMCVYTPLWWPGAESVQEEWDVIVRGLGAQGITFLVTLYTAGRVQAGP